MKTFPTPPPLLTRYVCTSLLEHPRKCYTHLFPAGATFWLVITVIAFNVIEFICFCALDFDSPALQSTPGELLGPTRAWHSGRGLPAEYEAVGPY